MYFSHCTETKGTQERGGWNTQTTISTNSSRTIMMRSLLKPQIWALYTNSTFATTIKASSIFSVNSQKERRWVIWWLSKCIDYVELTLVCSPYEPSHKLLKFGACVLQNILMIWVPFWVLDISKTTKNIGEQSSF